MKILVVEDENALREVIVRSLEKEQYYVFKLEHENNEVRLTFNSEAQLLK